MMRSMRAAALAAALLIGSTVTAGAQGGPPGGGGPGGMRRAPDAMALLERPLAGVEGLTDAQKDTLGKLEAAYKPKFVTMNTAMREAMMAARQSGNTPDMASMMKMREAMVAMRKEELAAARALLTAAQHPKFDENVKAEDAERDAMRGRMGGGGPPR
ncbi:MAG: Spy/CpxP family protein refolding chaperone [Gemmatimonadaceae bacterium]|nr:Spy/CpxP family protein refolding chaperone [Gemmatimonadaceae bacterium]